MTLSLVRLSRSRFGVCSQGVALLLCLSIARFASGAPADITTTAAPTIGADPPKGVKVETGDAKVSPQTGALQYGYPIVVPPGRGGAVPSLSLAYSSQGALYGGVAAGWTLAGIPEIHRDYSQGYFSYDRPNGNEIEDAFSPRWVSSMAGGRTLIQVGGEPAPAYHFSYRAQADDRYTRYQLAGNGSGASYTWLALTTDGSRYEFGFGAKAEFPDWAPLTRYVDAFGNQVVYNWEPVHRLGQVADLRVASIEYSRNDNAGLSAHARVVFNYDDTPFPCKDNPVGGQLLYANERPRWKGASALLSIQTQVRDTPSGRWTEVRRYNLTYDRLAAMCSAPHTPNRLLTRITERSNGVQLRPTVTMTYGALGLQHSGSLSIKYDSSIATDESLGYGSRVTVNPVISSTMLSRLLDLTGDSRPDRMYSSGSGGDAVCSVNFNRNIAAASFDVDFEPGETSTPQGVPPEPWANANGLNTGTLDATIQESCSLTGQYTKVQNREPEPGCYGSNLGHYKYYRYLDMNGDGFPDLVTALHYDKRYWDINQSPQSTTPPADPPPPGEEGPACLVAQRGCMASAIVCDKGCTFDRPAIQACLDGATATDCFTVATDPDISPVFLLDGGKGPFPEGLGDGHGVGFPVPPSSGCFPAPVPEPGSQGRFKWEIYFGNKDGTFNVGDPKVIDAPIPLASHSGDMGPKQNNTTVSTETHAIMDMDGDGFLDLVHMAKDDNNAYWQYWRGDGTGKFAGKENGENLLWTLPAPGIKPRSVSSTNAAGVIETIQTSGLMDLNGDGRPDLVYRPAGVLEVHYNTGTGFSQQGYPLGGMTLSRATIDAHILENGPTPWPHVTTRRTVDIDGDGRPDWQEEASGYAWAWFNMLGGFSDPYTMTGNPTVQEQSNVTADYWTTMSTLLDLNGDGIADQLRRTLKEYPTAQTTPNNGQRRGLLHTIDNGRGLTVDVKYAPHTDKSKLVQMGSAPCRGRPGWCRA